MFNARRNFEEKYHDTLMQDYDSMIQAFADKFKADGIDEDTATKMLEELFGLSWDAAKEWVNG